MICNQNEKNSRKLLIAVLAMFIVVAGTAIVLSDEASAAPDIEGNTANVGTFEDLKQVLANPGEVTTVNLTADITFTETINTRASGITINGAKSDGSGNWKIIDYSGKDHAIGLEGSESTFTFKNIDFVSQTDAYGTVLNINNQSALIEDCSFVGTANHGAVQVYGAADVTIDNCTFDDLAEVHLNYTSDTVTFKGCTGVTLAIATANGVSVAITDETGAGPVKIDSPDTIKKLVLGWDFGNGWSNGAPNVQISTEVNVDEVAVGADTANPNESSPVKESTPAITETADGSLTSVAPLPEDITYGTADGEIITGTVTQEIAAALDSSKTYVFRDATIPAGVTIKVSVAVVDEGTLTNNGTLSASVRMAGGTLVNNGTVNAAYLNIQAGTITNNGTISVTTALQNNAGSNAYSFTNAADGKVTISGTMGAISIANSGRVTITGSNSASAMTILGGIVDLSAYKGTYYPTMGDSQTRIIYDGREYTIYQAVYSNVNYQYGVYLEPIDYAPTITIEKLVSSAKAFPVDADHSIDLTNLEQPTWYEPVTGGYTGELRDYTVGENPGKVLYNGTVTISGSNQPVTFWKILGLYINPVEATITDLQLQPWDVKNEPNAPSFTYTVNGTDYEYPNLPEGADAVITLEKDGQVWSMDQWGDIDEAGEYILRVTVPTWDVCGEASETITVNLENETDRESVLTFEEYDQSLVYDISVDRLQSGLRLPTQPFTFTDHATTGTITATVYYLDSYTGFWGETDDVPGYYVVFALAQDKSATSWQDAYLKIDGPVSGEKTFDGTFDGFFVLYLGKELPAAEAPKLTFTIAYDQDGLQQDWYGETTYTITLDVTGAEWNYPGIYLYDEKNESWAADDYYYLMTSVSDTYQLPSVSKEGAPNGWYSEVTGEYFQAGTLFVIGDKYADASGRIVLKAQYDETTTPGGDTSLENASKNVTAYISSIDGGIRVLIEANDAGAYVDSGYLVVSYTYAHQIGNITIYQTFVMDAVPVNSNGTAYLAVELDISADTNYMSITGISVTYTGDNGSSDISDVISYTPSLPETAAVRA